MRKRKVEIVNCATCDNELERLPHQIKASKTGLFFCNRECRSKWDSVKFKDERVIFTCPICKSEEKVTKSKFKDKKYCSLDCLAKQKSINGTTEVICDYCNTSFIKKNAMINGKNFCKKSCSTKWFSENTNIQITKECIICSKPFKVSNNRKDTAKTCGMDCHYKHIKDISNNGHMAEQLRKNGVKSSLSQKNYDTLPELIVEKYLQDNNIPFEKQVEFHNKFIVDFYLPDMNFIIEVYGDYWHCNPRKYGFENDKTPPSEQQLKQMKKDKARKNYLTKCGYRFSFIWEHDIKNDIEKTIKSIIN